MISSFQGLRAFAFFLVFIHHAGFAGAAVPDTGARGVEIFFVLSGFLMMLHYSESHYFDKRGG